MPPTCMSTLIGAVSKNSDRGARVRNVGGAVKGIVWKFGSERSEGSKDEPDRATGQEGREAGGELGSFLGRLQQRRHSHLRTRPA